MAQEVMTSFRSETLERTKKNAPVSSLFHQFRSERICIVGAAPCVWHDLERRPIRVDEKTIVLNSAFGVRPCYDVHVIANREFLKLYQTDLTLRGVVLRPHSFCDLGYIEEFWYFPAWALKGEIPDAANSLCAGHSALIPALHFALRCGCKEIFLYGVDMGTGYHWDDGRHINASAKGFAAWRLVCKEVHQLSIAFPACTIWSVNPSSMLVIKRVLKSVVFMSARKK